MAATAIRIPERNPSASSMHEMRPYVRRSVDVSSMTRLKIAIELGWGVLIVSLLFKDDSMRLFSSFSHESVS
nr:TPA_asm: m119.5 uORF 1 [Murid betaherpesvirus 1]DBA07899.1 TPA_asm: m119.5 uORF 1 [Murid betaherpesvirus 1]